MIKSFNGKTPKVDESAFIAENVLIIGDVEIGKGSSVWYGSVVRGDMAKIKIGDYTNIQDLTCMHTDEGFTMEIGNYVTIGHRAILHGCKVEDFVMIGMGAIILNGAWVGRNSIIAAGSVVKEGFVIPQNSLVAGIPAEIKRTLTERDLEMIQDAAQHYFNIANIYKNL